MRFRSEALSVRALHTRRVMVLLAGLMPISVSAGFDLARAQQVAYGTAFAVADNYLLTNNHVIKECKANTLVYYHGLSSLFGGDRVPDTLRVVAADADADLALLLPLRSSAWVFKAEFRRDDSSITEGEPVTVVGYPLRDILGGINVTNGIVSALAGLGGAPQLVQISAEIQPGNSGGPMFDDRGRVIGVIVSQLDAVKMATATGRIPQNINFAIRGPVVRAFLERHGVRYQMAPPTSGPALTTVDIAGRAKMFTFGVTCEVQSGG
jgi:S1-C subfamily serine protease